MRSLSNSSNCKVSDLAALLNFQPGVFFSYFYFFKSQFRIGKPRPHIPEYLILVLKIFISINNKVVLQSIKRSDSGQSVLTSYMLQSGVRRMG